MKQMHKFCALLCAWALLLAAICLPALAETEAFAGGSGTAEDPYQVATAEQLDAVREDLSASYILTADIDLTGIDNWEPIGWFDFGAEDEAGYYANGFAGTFDGAGHTVSGLTADRPEGVGVGLIGLVTTEGEVKNLTVEHALISGYMAVGGIVGYNCGTVENLTLAGENEITGVNCTGGIVGGNEFGTILNCGVDQVTVNVLGDNDFSDGRIVQVDVAECGGLIVGGSFGGTLEGCTAKGEIVALGNEPVGLGGIGGCLEYMEAVSGCTADVTITAPNGAHAVGGLCGYAGTVDPDNPALLSGCTLQVTMNIPGATHVGGVVGTGLYIAGMESVFTVQNCTVSGEINGAVTPGAIAGRAEGSTVEGCTASVLLDGEGLDALIGTTDRMYESEDQ